MTYPATPASLERTKAHTPGPWLTKQEAMEIAVLLTLRASQLADLNRSAFAGELSRTSGLISRFDEWLADTNPLAYGGCMCCDCRSGDRCDAARAAIAKATGATK